MNGALFSEPRPPFLLNIPLTEGHRHFDSIGSFFAITPYTWPEAIFEL